MSKEEVQRGSRKRFECYITDLATPPNPQNPDSCQVRLEKCGDYAPESPTIWYTCSQTGTDGYWGADVFIPRSWTLGDWIARFRWYISGVEDGEVFEFVLIRKDKPLDSTPVVIT